MKMVEVAGFGDVCVPVVDEQKYRYLITWRMTGEWGLEWAHTIAEYYEVDEILANLKKNGVIQYYTYILGEFQPDKSCEF